MSTWLDSGVRRELLCGVARTDLTDVIAGETLSLDSLGCFKLPGITLWIVLELVLAGV